jgi:hypothetical protein
VVVIAEELEKKRTKLGTYRLITNFLAGSIKNRKIEKFL